MDGAGAALRDTASVLGAGQAELLADDPQQRRVRIAIEVAARAVDVERDGHVELLVQGRTPSGGSAIRMRDRRPRTRSTRRSMPRAAPACRARARGFRRASIPSPP